MPQKRWDTILLGTIIGLLLPPLMLVGLHTSNYADKPLFDFLVYAANVAFLAPLLSFCLTLNLAVFFLLYLFKLEMAPRGMIMATFFWGLVIVYFKFLYL